jgi:hypothetical protein
VGVQRRISEFEVSTMVLARDNRSIPEMKKEIDTLKIKNDQQAEQLHVVSVCMRTHDGGTVNQRAGRKPMGELAEPRTCRE